MKKYRLYDLYDYFGLTISKENRIGEYNTREEATQAASLYDKECDGECDIYICKYNPEAKKFLAIDAEPLNYGG